MRMPEDMKTGVIFTSNDGLKYVVVQYANCKNVLIRFINTGDEITTSSALVRRGSLRDRLSPSVFGVGFIGNGVFKSNGVNLECYQCWANMLMRCYDKEFQKGRPTYAGCIVSSEWHNYQSFAKWYYENYPSDGMKYHLDKDKLITGNKLYGPDSCCFLTAKENVEVSLSKKVTLLSPKGNPVNVFNVSKFCRDNNLSQAHISAVSTGKRKSHKGWRLA